ncbi:MAG: beta-hydroxyacyl-ACP dehydratase [Planctomycetes bacterium]|nr:beta-hydroxyacyl-ACP dehydratase [Planctomycetota bacterium]
MKFDLIDDVLERTDDRIVAIKQVTLAEEYLGDHFPGFPILPGVLMLETMVQAARRLLGDRDEGPLVLGRVRALKYGAMVRPGEALEVEVTAGEPGPDGGVPCRGTGRVRRGGETYETAVSGRFTMRPIRLDSPA